MPPKRERNQFLEAATDDDSDHGNDSEGGYDSEEAEQRLRKGKTGRSNEDGVSNKRRKVDSEDDAESDYESPAEEVIAKGSKRKPGSDSRAEEEAQEYSQEEYDEDDDDDGDLLEQTEDDTAANASLPTTKPSTEPKSVESSSKSKASRPGIIYLPSLPPHLKPSALKNLLQQRGFEPVTRLFLTPAVKSSGQSSSRARKTYSEGWVEFGSHKTAKKCVAALNASPIGGPKRGYYYDDLWNMRYLRGMSWMDLMGQIREERREEEVRKWEERRRVKSEVETFLQGVEKSKRLKTEMEREETRKKTQENEDEEEEEEKGKGQKKKKKSQKKNTTTPDLPAFEWKQFKLKSREAKPPSSPSSTNLSSRRENDSTARGTGQDPGLDADTRRILGKIF